MKVILQKDIKDLGKAGDLLNVSTGYFRNFLFPRNLALEATESKVKEWEHLKKVSEAKKKKALEEKKSVVAKLNGLSLTFKVSAGESDKLFGAVTQSEISKELDKHGFSVDKRDIVLDEQIKILGKHKAHVKFAEGLAAELSINVERA
jgi:large subunit ribosomal protein L9